MSVITLTSQNFEVEVNGSDRPVLIDFWASWCGPCRMIAPVIDEIAAERGDIKVCKVNVDEEQELAARYGVMSIPTLVAIEGGEVKDKSVGVVAKEQILSMF